MTTIELISGASVLIISLIYYRENRKRKEADTRLIDTNSLTKTIKALEEERESLLNRMQKQIDSMQKRMDELQAELDLMKNSLRLKDAELINTEKTLNIYKRSFVCRIECDKDICPIETKLNELKK